MSGDQTSTRRTDRGFDLIQFSDQRGNACSLQKSSAADHDCIWLGCDDIGLKRFVPFNGGWQDVPLEQNGPRGIVHVANTRMHLTREQVDALLPYLQRFVDTGELT